MDILTTKSKEDHPVIEGDKKHREEPSGFEEVNLKYKISEILSYRERKIINNSDAIPAAVLVPLFIKDGVYHLLFTKRTETLETHKGQISFPGGVKDGEERLLETALRETYEEIGILKEDIEILGPLDDMLTGTGYSIFPLVGFIPYPYNFCVNADEVAELLEVPLEFLLDKKNFIEDENYVHKGKPYHYMCFRYGTYDIWGTTARILRNFLNLFFD